ncbi:unnamed protein product [Boreogadus saida]
MEFKEAGVSVCVFVYVYTLVSARALHPCAEQGTTRVENLENANVGSDEPKLFPDHVTTQENLENANVVSDKPKLFPDHVTTQVCWKDRSQKMQLFCQKVMSYNYEDKEIGKKERNIRRRSHTSHNIRHKEKHAVKKERYKTCHQKTMDARGVCSN